MNASSKITVQILVRIHFRRSDRACDYILNPVNDPRGRRPRDPREVLNGIMWILRTGAPWKDLPHGIRHTKDAIGGFSNGC